MSITKLITWPIRLIQNYRFDSNLKSFIDLSKNTSSLFAKVDGALKAGKVLRVCNDESLPTVYAVSPRNRISRWLAGSQNKELFDLVDNINYVAQARLASLGNTMGWRSEEVLEKDVSVLGRCSQRWTEVLEQLETLGATFERVQDGASSKLLAERIRDLKENLNTCSKIQRKLESQLQPVQEIVLNEEVEPLQELVLQDRELQREVVENHDPEIPQMLIEREQEDFIPIPPPLTDEGLLSFVPQRKAPEEHQIVVSTNAPPAPPLPTDPKDSQPKPAKKVPAKPQAKREFSPDMILAHAKELNHVEESEKERPKITESADKRGASPSLLIAGKKALKKVSQRKKAPVVKQPPLDPMKAMMEEAAKKIVARRAVTEIPFSSDEESDEELWD